MNACMIDLLSNAKTKVKDKIRIEDEKRSVAMLKITK
jgi:hypothetical protein